MPLYRCRFSAATKVPSPKSNYTLSVFVRLTLSSPFRTAKDRYRRFYGVSYRFSWRRPTTSDECRRYAVSRYPPTRIARRSVYTGTRCRNDNRAYYSTRTDNFSYCVDAWNSYLFSACWAMCWVSSTCVLFCSPQKWHENIFNPSCVCKWRCGNSLKLSTSFVNSAICVHQFRTNQERRQTLKRQIARIARVKKITSHVRYAVIARDRLFEMFLQFYFGRILLHTFRAPAINHVIM